MHPPNRILVTVTCERFSWKNRLAEVQ